MSNNTAAARLCPDPSDVFKFVDTVVQVRYRLLVNYLGAESTTGEPPPPPVVRKTFQELIKVTLSINDGRPEGRKIDPHVTAARELVDRFEREWLSKDHRIRAEDRKNARGAITELTEYDWASFRRDASAEESIPPSTSIDAEMLRDSPFRDDSWKEYEAAVQKFVETFDSPCQTLYRLVRVLAEVCYPNPASYDATLGTLRAFDDEYIIKYIYTEVRQLIVEFQKQTCFNLNVGEWFNASNPYRSIVRLLRKIKKILRRWGGEVSVPPELDRPRWQPAPPGSKNQGVLSFGGQTAPVAKQAKVIVPVLQAFEDVSWQKPVPFPPGKVYRSVLQSLENWAAKNHLALKFYSETMGNQHFCRWKPTVQPSEPEGVPDDQGSPVVKRDPLK